MRQTCIAPSIVISIPFESADTIGRPDAAKKTSIESVIVGTMLAYICSCDRGRGGYETTEGHARLKEDGDVTRAEMFRICINCEYYTSENKYKTRK